MALAQYADGGLFAPRKIAEAFRTTNEEIARTAGLDKDAIQRKDRVRSDMTQRRLREMVEVVNKVEPRFGFHRDRRSEMRDQMKANGVSRQQSFAKRLVAADYHGLLVKSFAPRGDRGRSEPRPSGMGRECFGSADPD